MIKALIYEYTEDVQDKKGVIFLKALHMAAFTLLVVGGLNWGLVALFNMNLVETIFGGIGLTNIVYILVGVSAVYIVATHMSDCKVCAK